MAILSMAVVAGAAPVKVACIGNSITSGSIAGVNPYPVHLAKLLGAAYQVENEGVSGTTLLKKGDSPYWTKGRLAQALAFKPSIITIKLGTNDTKPQNWKYKSEFAADLNALLDTLGTISPKPVIWLCLPVPAWPVNGTNSYGIDGTTMTNEVIPIIKQVAADRKLKTIDLHTPMLGMSAHFADGVHPDSVGQDSIAHIIYHALTAVTALEAPPQTGPGTSAAGGIASLPEVGLRGSLLSVGLRPNVPARLTLSDAQGRARETWMLPQGGEARYSLANLPPGPYLLSVESSQGRSAKRLDLR
jgi:lysophospholipase L1-like esterase